MTETRITIVMICALGLLSFACSQPDPNWTTATPSSRAQSDQPIPDNSIADSDSLRNAESNGEIDQSLDKAEDFYAIGVNYFQTSQLDSAQTAYEQSLTILSELDLDPEQSPDQAARMERLLSEIEEDYRLTLMSSGTLSSDASVTAFRELFGDLKNFNKLKESGVVKEFSTADTAKYDIDIEWNDKVENSLIYLQTVAREKFTIYLAHSGAYLPIMEKIFKEKGLPHDLVYLPLIESGFKATAYSYARASGFWQFISSTGKLYGLEHNWWFDERRDFEKSTRAAAAHLKDLYDLFGSWNLALAAYNGGSGRVGREIKKSKTNNFWKLALHKQTKAYVPLFMAATIIAKEPQKYGFFPDYEKPIEFDTVVVRKCISFKSISAKTGIDIALLERLNPELLRGITPPNTKEYSLRLPIGHTEVFASIYDDIPTEKATGVAKHRVKRGETLSSIASKYGASAAAIMDVNGLSKNKRIYAGQVLNIPVSYGKSYKPAPVPVKSAAAPPTSSDNPTKPMARNSSNRYMVKNGDTLWEIAAAHGVSITELKRINNLKANSLYAGRWIKVPAQSTESARVEAADIKYEIYRVKRGDNLSKIASRYGISPESITGANRLSSNKLYAGMSLKIPAMISSEPQRVAQNSNDGKELKPIIYTVRQGDTLWNIARAHGVNVGDVARWNNLSQRSRLYPGDKLKIYL